MAPKPGPRVAQRQARPQRQVGRGGGAVTAQVAPRQLSQRPVPVVSTQLSGRAAAQPVAGEHERLAAAHHRAAHRRPGLRGLEQQVHERLAAWIEVAAGQHAADRASLHRAVGERALDQAHRPLGAAGRESLLQQPPRVRLALWRAGQPQQPGIVVGLDHVQRAAAEPADHDLSPADGVVHAGGGDAVAACAHGQPHGAQILRLQGQQLARHRGHVAGGRAGQKLRGRPHAPDAGGVGGCRHVLDHIRTKVAPARLP